MYFSQFIVGSGVGVGGVGVDVGVAVGIGVGVTFGEAIFVPKNTPPIPVANTSSKTTTAVGKEVRLCSGDGSGLTTSGWGGVAIGSMELW